VWSESILIETDNAETVPMLTFDAAQLSNALQFPYLVDFLKDGLKQAIHSPIRTSHAMAAEGDTLLSMPSWIEGEAIGVKLVTIFGANSSKGMPGVQGLYNLFDGATGRPVAVMDGTELTYRRTAALAALASKLSAAPHGGTLVVIGTGGLAPHIARAHYETGLVERVVIWGRNSERSKQTARALREEGVDARHAENIEMAVREASIVTCVTSANTPVIENAWLSGPVHVNLMGSYAPHLQEAPAELIGRARLFVDHREAVLAESGDLIIPIRDGIITEDAIENDIAGLAKAEPVSRKPSDVTVFKSVGWGALDLIAAQAAVHAVNRPNCSMLTSLRNRS
jgi:ornithine cyclodeaminase